MQVQKRLHRGLIAVMLAGGVLFHPIVAGVDLIPDAIAYLLLYVGLSCFADMNGHLAEARRRFRMMLFVGIGHLLSTYVVYGMIEKMMQERPQEMSRYEAPMLVLLFSFILLVLQWLFLIPAWKEFFLGFQTLTERFGTSKEISRGAEKTRFERMVTKSRVFVIVSSLLSILPEASVLTSYEAYKGSEIFRFDWFAYVGLFRTAAGVISFAFGVAWLISYLQCIGQIRRDSIFMKASAKAYENTVLPEVGMLSVRRFRSVFLLFAIGSVFSASFRINDRAMLPGIVFSVLALIGVLLLGPRVSKKRGCIASSVLLAIVSLTELVVNHLFLTKHIPEASLYETDAYWRFMNLRILDAAEAIATLLLIGSLLDLLYELVKTYTGIDYGTKGSEVLSCRATERQHQAFRSRLLVLFGIFFLSAAAGVADAAFRLEYAWIWIIGLCSSVIGIWMFCSLMQDLFEQICFYFRSDGVNKNV